MRHKWLYIVVPIAALMFIAFMAGVVAYLASMGGGSSGSIFGGGKVGVIRISGAIISADETVRDIEDIRKDGGIKSVVLRIESPGGSVGASQEILEAVKLLAEEKPVVASMGSVAASGGYYVACGATRIMANPGTITGSIGVRMEHVSIGDVLKWARIDHETLKTGRFKDLGSIDRPLDAEERALIQGVMGELLRQFKQAIAESRGLEMEEVDALSDGSIYTGQRAIELGLVDSLGGFAEAIRLAAELGGIEGEPSLAYPRKRGGWLKRMVESAAHAANLFAGVRVDYWRPVMEL